ncbi:alkyl hydroperoxide reductase subunit F [Ahniella affigens]|uniref:Alkyl hydroperoxide reductase subunit F n=1 Tax=Ahniella affigens TaxID=2021234 RepID=A0A2P1PVA6_9GAMM|nr:alkyl hydroperoxide reductase subunit F [Ahniella affigens]AVP98760.1 alkyl hydroperoxide reductase subunit F [Ahniella affigens]
MLEQDLKDALKSYLERLTRPLVLLANVDESAASHELRTLLAEIAEASAMITVQEQHDPSLRVPSFAVGSPGHDIKLRFAGIPLGHEFTSLVLALLQAGGYPPKVSAETIEAIKQLPGPLRFESFFSLSCQNCPDVVQALNLMAVLNPNIDHVAIEGGAFQHEVEARQVMSVPSVFLNGELFAVGRMSIEEIVAKLDTGAAARDAETLKQKDPFDVLIVGGGPAGAAAAVYAARKGIRTGLVAERFGGQVMDTMGIENLISVPETEGPKLVAALENHVGHYDVDVMKLQRAEKLSVANDLVTIQLASGASLSSKTVIIATGARWRQMNVPGEAEYRNKGVAYCPHCDGPLFKGKRVAVIGGGNSGVEAAIDLAGIVSHVTLIEFDGQLRADAVLQRKLRSLSNVRVIVSAQTTEVKGDGQRVTGLVYKDRGTNDLRTIDLEGIFVQIGLLPNSDWLKGALELTNRGEIVVDAKGATSLPGVFAAGDVTTTPYKQIVIAMGEGSKAALSAFDHLIRMAVPEPAKQAA